MSFDLLSPSKMDQGCQEIVDAGMACRCFRPVMSLHPRAQSLPTGSCGGKMKTTMQWAYFFGFVYKQYREWKFAPLKTTTTMLTVEGSVV
jgi:hypothetical protein